MRFLVKYRHVITAVVACILFSFLIYIGVRTKDIKNVNLKNSVYAGNAFGTAINDSAAPTYMNLIFALSLMGDMPTNKARTSDNAQQQSASNAVPISYSVF